MQIPLIELKAQGLGYSGFTWIWWEVGGHNNIDCSQSEKNHNSHSLKVCKHAIQQSLTLAESHDPFII